MLEAFYILFSFVFLITSFILLILRKFSLLPRGIIFSAVISGMFLGAVYFNLLSIPQIVKKFFSLQKREEKCKSKSIHRLSSDNEVNKIFLLKHAIEVENMEKFLEVIDPILKDRVLSSLDPYVENMDVCGAREFLKSAFGIYPATPFMLKTSEYIEPQIISKWLKRADGFIFENKLLLSPVKLIEMFPEELTGGFEISENRIIIYLRKR